MSAAVSTTTGTALYGVTGWPLSQSLSPLLHNTGFAALGINALYMKWEVPPHKLPAFVESVRLLNIRGCSVTIPHKVGLLPLLDEVSPLAMRVGAANTIYWKGERLCGENTDVAGFMAPLANVPLAGADVLLLGAGGAARAVGDECINARVSSPLAGMAVPFLARTAQLKHIAEQRDLPGIGQCLEDRERSLHAVGAGVIAVLNEGDAALFHDMLAHARRPVGRQRGSAAGSVQTQAGRGGVGGQRRLQGLDALGRGLVLAVELLQRLGAFAGAGLEPREEDVFLRVVALLGVGVEVVDHRLEQPEIRLQAAGDDFLEHEADGVEDGGEGLMFVAEDAKGFHRKGSPETGQRRNRPRRPRLLTWPAWPGACCRGPDSSR